MKFLKKVDIKEFQDCDATVKFIETIDWLFDVLNNKNSFGKGFKQPLTKNCLTYLKEIIPEKINYLIHVLFMYNNHLLFNVKVEDGTKLLKRRRTFIYGFALVINSRRYF